MEERSLWYVRRVNVEDYKEIVPDRRVFFNEPDFIELYLDKVDTILLFAGDYVEDAAELLDYIRKVCEDDQLYLCVIGYPGEIKTIEEIIPMYVISCEFTRPFEMKNVISSIVSLTGGIIAEDDQKKK